MRWVAPANVPPVADGRGGTMAGMIFFTDNYQDRSTNDGYQFEFFCRRCGNGYRSSFQASAPRFRGRVPRRARSARGEEKPFLPPVPPLRPVGVRAGVLERPAGPVATCAPRLDQEIAGM